MTQQSALDILTRLDPRRTYCVGCDEWRNTYSHMEPNTHTDYRISVFPVAQEPRLPTQFHGPDLSEVMGRAIEFIKSDNETTA